MSSRSVRRFQFITTLQHRCELRITNDQCLPEENWRREFCFPPTSPLATIRHVPTMLTMSPNTIPFSCDCDSVFISLTVFLFLRYASSGEKRAVFVFDSQCLPFYSANIKLYLSFFFNLLFSSIDTHTHTHTHRQYFSGNSYYTLQQ